MTKNYEIVTLIICVSVIIAGLIAGAFIYNINDRNNMAQNMESAIAKGIDPLSIKCAYETNANPVCITMAASRK
jgi:uncharacterized membrane protein